MTKKKRSGDAVTNGGDGVTLPAVIRSEKMTPEAAFRACMERANKQRRDLLEWAWTGDLQYRCRTIQDYLDDDMELVVVRREPNPQNVESTHEGRRKP